MNFADAPSSTVPVLRHGGNTGVSARLTSGGKLQLFNDVTGLQTGSDSAATLVMDGTTWYRIELSVTLGVSSLVTASELQLDGTSVATASVSLTESDTSVAIGWVTAPGASKVCYVDDIAVNDATGATNTSWPGSGKVVLLKPISDNARVGWTNAAAGTTNLFNDVNNTPPVGVASPSTQPAQIKRNAANTTDTYDANLTSYTTAGLAAGDTLNAILLLSNQAYSFNAAASQGVQMLSNPVISEFTYNSPSTSAGTYPTNWAWGTKLTEYSGLVSSSVTVGTSPVMRVRKNTSSSARIQFCDAMFAYVDYSPAAAAAAQVPYFNSMPQLLAQ
jgi:hypothetical protein